MYIQVLFRPVKTLFFVFTKFLTHKILHAIVYNRLLSIRCVTRLGLQIFFKIGGPKIPMEQKIVGHFLKWWAQAYQTKHSWHLCSILYLHTDTDTCMHICVLTADYTVNPILSGHWKKKTNCCLMQVKSIAECSKGSILQYFWPSLSYHLLLRYLFCLFLSGCLRRVLLY